MKQILSIGSEIPIQARKTYALKVVEDIEFHRRNMHIPLGLTSTEDYKKKTYYSVDWRDFALEEGNAYSDIDLDSSQRLFADLFFGDWGGREDTGRSLDFSRPFRNREHGHYHDIYKPGEYFRVQCVCQFDPLPSWYETVKKKFYEKAEYYLRQRWLDMSNYKLHVIGAEKRKKTLEELGMEFFNEEAVYEFPPESFDQIQHSSYFSGFYHALYHPKEHFTEFHGGKDGVKLCIKNLIESPLYKLLKQGGIFGIFKADLCSFLSTFVDNTKPYFEKLKKYPDLAYRTILDERGCGPTLEWACILRKK